MAIEREIKGFWDESVMIWMKLERPIIHVGSLLVIVSHWTKTQCITLLEVQRAAAATICLCFSHIIFHASCTAQKEGQRARMEPFFCRLCGPANKKKLNPDDSLLIVYYPTDTPRRFYLLPGTRKISWSEVMMPYIYSYYLRRIVYTYVYICIILLQYYFVYSRKQHYYLYDEYLLFCAALE